MIVLPVRALQTERPDAAALSPHRPAGEKEEKKASLWLSLPAGWKGAESLATIRCCGSPEGTQTDRRRYGGGKLGAAGKDEKITAANFSINKPSEDFAEIYPQRCFRGGACWQITPHPSPLHTITHHSVRTSSSLFIAGGRCSAENSLHPWCSNFFSQTNFEKRIFLPNTDQIPGRSLFISGSSCQNPTSCWEQWRCCLLGQSAAAATILFCFLTLRYI